jgi:hypothetical protein
VFAVAMLILFLTVSVNAQLTQFSFDLAGDLQAETAENPRSPQIIGQPQMQVATPGQAASFSVVLADTSNLSYQWYFINTAIPGATSDALLLTNVSAANEGVYWVVVLNSFGSAASTLANLYIDSRGCGMPDSWQLQYFGNLNQNPLGDYDGDGVSNLQEFLDGTNPTNAASALYRISVVNDGGTVLVSPNQSTYTSGQMVMLTATGSSSAPFHAWTGDVVTRSSSIAITMTNNLNLFAHFLPFAMVWTNLQSGDWNVAVNWSPNLAPVSNESAIIGDSGISSFPTITQNSNVDLVDFTIGNSDFIPVLTGSGRITISGTGLWNSGTMSGTGSIVVQPGASLTLTTSGLTLSRTLENAGSMALEGANFALGGILTNDAGAQFQLSGPATISFGGGSSRFDNAGLFVTSASPGVTSFAGVPFNNFGTVEILGGTLLLSGGGTDAGVITVPAGTTLDLAGGEFTSSGNPSITGAGNFLVSGALGTLGGTVFLTGSNVFSNGSIDFTGTYILTNAPLPISGCAVSFDGTSLVTPTVLTLSGGSLGGSNLVTVSSAMNWSGGSLAGTGRTLVLPSAPLNITCTSPMFITSRTLEIGGSATWTGASLISMNGGVITNDAGATFNALTPMTLQGGGSARFDNAGVYRTAPVAGTTTLSVAFNNYNDTQLQGGTLQLGGGGLNNGTMEVPAGTTLVLGNGAFNASPASSITGAGNFTVNFATATLAGLLNVTGTNTFSDGTADLTGNYICTNNTLIVSGAIAYFDGTGPVSPRVLNLSAGTTGGSQLVTVGSVMNWTGGALNGSGRTFIPPGAALNIICTSPLFITSYTLEIAGSATWTGTSVISMNGGVITNGAGATFNIQGPLSLSSNSRFDNAGVVRAAAGAGTINVTAAYNNYHDTQIQSGTLQLGGGGLNNGTMEVPAGTTLVLGGGAFSASPASSITGAGSFTVNFATATLAGLLNVTGTNAFSNGSAELSGKYICTNNTLSISGATVSFDGSGPVSPAVLNLSGGVLGGSNVVTALNVMNWTGGSLNGVGRTVISPGATLNIAGAGPFFGNNRTLENAGTAFWTGPGSLSLNGNIITNRAGALFNAQNASSINFGGGSPRFDNAGTFRKSVSTGTTAFGTVNFTNYGLVDLQSGVLQMNNSVYASSSNAVLRCALAGNIPGTNFGQLQLPNPGAVTLNGALSVELTNNYIPTTNDLFTLVTAGTRNGAFSSFSYPSNKVAMVLTNTPSSVIVRATDILAVPQPFLFPPQLSGSNVLLTWTSVTNGVYRLQFNPGLSPSNWSALAGDVTALGNTASKLDPLTSSNRNYRVLGLHP